MSGGGRLPVGSTMGSSGGVTAPAANHPAIMNPDRRVRCSRADADTPTRGPAFHSTPLPAAHASNMAHLPRTPPVTVPPHCETGAGTEWFLRGARRGRARGRLLLRLRPALRLGGGLRGRGWSGDVALLHPQHARDELLRTFLVELDGRVPDVDLL